MCQGREAPIVGPTAELDTTVGTEGDDAICLVGGGEPVPTGRTVSVDAGDGHDSVLTETVSSLNPLVTLGSGSAHYVGNDFTEHVDTGKSNGIDGDVDVVDTRGGNDTIGSGALAGVENHDLVSTGAGNDVVNDGNPSGEPVDTGTGAGRSGERRRRNRRSAL